MGLLKNGVGRPSNETLKKRKILILIVIGLVVTLLVGTGYFFKQNVINSNSKNASSKLTTVTKNGITFKYNKKLVYSGDYEAPFKYNFGVTKSNKGKTIYAKIAMYRNGKFLKSTQCRKSSVPFSESKYLTTSFAPYANSSYYAEFIVYSDAKCSKKIASVKTDTYKYPKTRPWVDYAEKYRINALNYVIFSQGGNPNYYYIMEVFDNNNNNNKVSKTTCKLVQAGKDVSYSDSKLQYYGNYTLKFNFYHDSKCSKLFFKAKDLSNVTLELPRFEPIAYGRERDYEDSSSIISQNYGLSIFSKPSKSKVLRYSIVRHASSKAKSFKNVWYKSTFSIVDNKTGEISNKKQIATCLSAESKGKINIPQLPSNSKYVQVDTIFYSDSKCKNKVYSGATRLISSSSKPTIISAGKNSYNYVFFDATDDMGISSVGWTTVGSSCKKLESKNTEVFVPNLRVSRLHVRKINTSKAVKLCVWDVEGNVSEKRISN